MVLFCLLLCTAKVYVGVKLSDWKSEAPFRQMAVAEDMVAM
jgi:hypothetical protein